MDYVAILQNNNLKVTPQRLEILDILYSSGHIGVDDLYKALQCKFPSLSLATIYKNINKMCEKLFVSEVKIPNEKNVYELTKIEHSHLVCSRCNTIVDIDLDISNLLEQAKSLSDFSLDKSSIVLNGLCPRCRVG